MIAMIGSVCPLWSVNALRSARRMQDERFFPAGRGAMILGGVFIFGHSCCKLALGPVLKPHLDFCGFGVKQKEKCYREPQ
jgi:hypothetical protein